MWSGRIPSNLGSDGSNVPYIYLPTTETTGNGHAGAGNIFNSIVNSGRAASNSDIFSRIRCPNRCMFWESLTTGQWRLLVLLGFALVVLTVILFSTLSVLEEQDKKLTDFRIQEITEELIFIDQKHNNMYSQLNITTNGTKLLQGTLDLLKCPTIATLIDLQYEYHPNVNVPEVFTDEYFDKQQRFLNAIINTQVMKMTEKVLLEAELIAKPILDTLEDVWFGLYSRSEKGINGSSGFEHIFAGETKHRILGFHNWIYFLNEQDNPKGHPNLTYNGYQGMLKLGNNGAIIHLDLKWRNMTKTSSMFIGTSPELEMAVYTLCFLARPNGECPVSMAGEKFSVYTYAYKDTMLLSSAYPHIEELGRAINEMEGGE